MEAYEATEGTEVHVAEPIKMLNGGWFLPDERLWVLEQRADRVRVRCGRSGVDGWLDLSDIHPSGGVE